MKKGLTFSTIFLAQSANYGEGFGNITTLKKLTRGDEKQYSYISRQALRYNMIEQLNWDKTPVKGEGSVEKKVVQFHPDATIVDYPEIDFFGYMKTIKDVGANTRSAVARLSHAISLESFSGDLDFLTNMGLARRGNEPNAIAQSEMHRSFYAYTMTIDLDRVGVDYEKDKEGNLIKEFIITQAEKTQRVQDLLKTVQFLYRDIKGRRENLSPLFIVGGVYDRKNPYFDGRLQMNKQKLNTKMLWDVMSSDADIKDNTEVGYLEGSFLNDAEIVEKFAPIQVGEFFDSLIGKVEAVYR